MRYSHLVTAAFLSRPNRFTARVMLDGREETVHVRNTGRCRELLIPGCRVWLEKADREGEEAPDTEPLPSAERPPMTLYAWKNLTAAW